MSEPLDALRQAAVTLLAAASPGAVLAATRALLADWELKAPSTPATRRVPADVADASVAKTYPAETASAPATNGDELAAWEALRQRVREARQARRLGMQDLADVLGVARSTLENTLQTRALPSGRMRQNLEQWLAAPEVAVGTAEPFRPNGTDHHDMVDRSDRLNTDNGTDRLAA
jgi:ribosome-binding protein aMBF1 (putative translation factor)